MHCVRDFQNPYYVGRHDFRHTSIARNMHIIKYVYGPFPDFFSRKLQIKTRIPETDKQYNFGHQHMIEFSQLDTDYKKAPTTSSRPFGRRGITTRIFR